MQTADEQIQNIELKLQLLLKEYQQLQKEVLRLQKQNATLQSRVEEQTGIADAHAQTIDVLKINTLTLNDTSRKELEQRINSYLKEIDKCMMMLQS